MLNVSSGQLAGAGEVSADELSETGRVVVTHRLGVTCRDQGSEWEISGSADEEWRISDNLEAATKQST